jgi:replicative DNA helicase
MKTNNTAIALIGLLAYKPENIAYISDRLRPEMFPGATLQSLAGAMWASYEAKQAWGAQDLRDFDEVLAEQALARPLPQDKLEQAADRLRAGWEARNIADIYQQAAKVAAKGDGIGARQQAEAQLELLQSSIALPNEKQAVLLRSIEHMEKYFKSSLGKRVTGIDTGFLYLNTETAGWQAGDINILAALPGRGKTTMALQSAIVAARLGHPVLFFSVGDSTAEQLYLKAAAIIAGIDFARILRNTITAEEKGRMSRAYEELSELPLRIYDTSQFNGTTGAIRDIARRDAINWTKMGLICVDYIQQLRPVRYIANVVDRLEEVSANIKQLTVGLKCSSLVLSQFSRDSAKGGIEREPTMSDLRGSGAIEQDASRIITIHTENGAVKLVMLKDRHGAMRGAKSVHIETNWLPEIGRYEWVYDSPFAPSAPAPALTSAMVEAQPGNDDEIPF